MVKNEDVSEILFNGEKSIGIFVVGGEYLYVVDDKENFCIDVHPYYQAYLEKGYITKDQYVESLEIFRGGVSILTSDNFKDYIIRTEAQIVGSDWLKNFFLDDLSGEDIVKFYSSVEKFLETGCERPDRWYSLRSKLPLFYINLDRQIFYHTDWDRLHEDYLPMGWKGKAGLEFCFLIPDRFQYWLIGGLNFWKLKM